MTSYLLDTSALLWALTEPARLGRAARRVIESRSSRLVVSAVSAWELSTKHRLGKLPQADVLLGAYTQHLDRLGVLRLPGCADAVVSQRWRIVCDPAVEAQPNRAARAVSAAR